MNLHLNTIKYMVGIKNKSGGKREGAGRPKGEKTTPISFKIDNDLLDFVNSQPPNRNRFINDCIRDKKIKLEAGIKPGD